MENEIITDFLKSFFMLLKINIKDYKFEGSAVIGSIVWDEYEEEQPFSWQPQFEGSVLLKLDALCKYLIKNNLITIDKITIPFAELVARLTEIGWSSIESKQIIHNLCSINVKMMDGGDEADSFFIHF